MTGTLIDVREYPEFAAGHIANAQLVPLSTLAAASVTWDKTLPLTLICKSGRRAQQAREQLAAAGFTHLTVLPGGMDAWCAAGNPILLTERRPWSLERHVRIAAGSLVVLTLLLAVFVSTTSPSPPPS